MAAKQLLTRRQWTSLLEAVLRLGTVSHVIWLCELHSRVWACLSEALGGAGPMTAEEARERMFPERFSYLPFSNKRSEEHTSELQSLMRISYAVFCLKKKKKNTTQQQNRHKTTKTINRRAQTHRHI